MGNLQYLFINETQPPLSRTIELAGFYEFTVHPVKNVYKRISREKFIKVFQNRQIDSLYIVV